MLGPFPVGKLEVDGDPAFLTLSSSGGDDGDGGDERGRETRASTGDVRGNERFDPALHLLSQHHLTTTAIRYASYHLHPLSYPTLPYPLPIPTPYPL